MQKAKIKIPAKLNLTLDITGQTENYHQIDSLVCSVNLFDEIVIKKRNDDKINLKITKILVDCEEKDNNAYKATLLFKKAYLDLVGNDKNFGVDIKIKKNIPLANGLGGSSADASGTLLCLQKLFNTNFDLSEMADKIGSDCSYMLKGGFARISGRGEIVESIDYGRNLYFLIVTSISRVSTKECYDKFDKKDYELTPCTSDVLRALKCLDFNNFLDGLSNHLYKPACELLSEIEKRQKILSNFGKTVMTGSGSALFLVFADKKKRKKAYKKIKKLYKKQVIKAETINFN